MRLPKPVKVATPGIKIRNLNSAVQQWKKSTSQAFFRLRFPYKNAVCTSHYHHAYHKSFSSIPSLRITHPNTVFLNLCCESKPFVVAHLSAEVDCVASSLISFRTHSFYARLSLPRSVQHNESVWPTYVSALCSVLMLLRVKTNSVPAVYVLHLLSDVIPFLRLRTGVQWQWTLKFFFFCPAFTTLYEFEPPHFRGSESHTRTHHSR